MRQIFMVLVDKRTCGKLHTAASRFGGIGACLEVFYNRQRRHSTINYVAPLAFEESTTA